MTFNVGWDIGGAHLKAALLNEKGEVLAIYQQPCPLWRGLIYLELAVKQILPLLPTTIRHHTLTMTGELVDFFVSRDAGVAAIIHTMHNYLPQQTLFIYAGKQGILALEKVTAQDYEDIASTNWLASASVVAQKIPTGLFVDIGSTTSDVLLCQNQAVQAMGFTDSQRLQSQELIYTGIVRTALMAVSQSVYFHGQPTGLMAEYFATMADVYRLTGDLQEAHDQTEPADGGEKNLFASAKRLARMIGQDFVDLELATYQQLACQFKQQQKVQLQQACLRQLSRVCAVEEIYFVGAGVGRFLVQEIAADLKLPYQDFSDFFPASLTVSEMTIADCAPAVAVAELSRTFTL